MSYLVTGSVANHKPTMAFDIAIWDLYLNARNEIKCGFMGTADGKAYGVCVCVCAAFKMNDQT